MDEAPTLSRSKLPWTIPTLIAIWTIVEGVRWVANRFEPLEMDFAFVVAEVFSFVYTFLIVGLVGYGLIKKQHFVWLIAFLWLGLQAGFGIINLVINGYPAEWILQMRQIPFYGGALPVAEAIVSFALLLLPATQNWVRGN